MLLINLYGLKVIHLPNKLSAPGLAERIKLAVKIPFDDQGQEGDKDMGLNPFFLEMIDGPDLD